MALAYLNRCIFTPSSGGTGTWTVSAPVTGYLTPANAGAADGTTYNYFAQSADLSEWEVGSGIYTVSGTTATRTPILSSNSNNLVNFTSAPSVHYGCALADYGTPTVGIVYQATYPFKNDALNNFTYANYIRVFFHGTEYTFIGNILTTNRSASYTDDIFSQVQAFNEVRAVSFTNIPAIDGSLIFDQAESLFVDTIDLSGVELITNGLRIEQDFVTEIVTIDFSDLKALGLFNLDMSANNTGDPLPTVWDFPVLEQVSGKFAFTEGGSPVPLIQQITAPNLVCAGWIDIESETALTTLDLSSLSLLATHDGANIINDVSLTTFSLPALVACLGTFDVSLNPSMTSVSLSALVRINGNLTVATNAVLTTIDLGALTTIFTGGIIISDNDLLTSIDIDALVTCNGVTVTGNAILASLSLAAIQNITGPVDGSANALTSVTLNSGLKEVGGDVTFATNALGQASVDHILVRLAALDGTGGTTSYDNHTVTLTGGTNATPSATGLAAKTTLVGRGNTVTNN